MSSDARRRLPAYVRSKRCRTPEVPAALSCVRATVTKPCVADIPSLATPRSGFGSSVTVHLRLIDDLPVSVHSRTMLIRTRCSGDNSHYGSTYAHRRSRKVRASRTRQTIGSGKNFACHSVVDPQAVS
ncbi:uncharacterized protein LOC142777254 [Rhipicephalus microplus]|uniref:uncharacterized protein LOC142777254 n=1 Tax=Rhipicephalus microplus TaxID=6941 RepID=UPI003F6C2619